jgi:hypothetical protein
MKGRMPLWRGRRATCAGLSEYREGRDGEKGDRKLKVVCGTTRQLLRVLIISAEPLSQSGIAGILVRLSSGIPIEPDSPVFHHYLLRPQT